MLDSPSVGSTVVVFLFLFPHIPMTDRMEEVVVDDETMEDVVEELDEVVEEATDAAVTEIEEETEEAVEEIVE
jgi:ribosome recycling factor